MMTNEPRRAPASDADTDPEANQDADSAQD